MLLQSLPGTYSFSILCPLSVCSSLHTMIHTEFKLYMCEDCLVREPRYGRVHLPARAGRRERGDVAHLVWHGEWEGGRHQLRPVRLDHHPRAREQGQGEAGQEDELLLLQVDSLHLLQTTTRVCLHLIRKYQKYLISAVNFNLFCCIILLLSLF